MHRLIRWTLAAGAGVVLFAAAGAAAVYLLTQSHRERIYDIRPDPVAIPDGAEALARGEHVATIRGCRECHGADLGGRVFIDDPMVGRIIAPNLTRGAGGIRDFAVADLLRAIRHGVGPDGRSLLFMPSFEFWYLGDEDVGALIAWIRSLPPVDNDLGESSLALPIRAIYLFTEEMDLFAAELIDHTARRPPAPAPEVSVAYGRYLAWSCVGCHGRTLEGGPIPGRPPDWPPASDLTSKGPLAAWSEEQFVATIRSGTTPDGRALNSAYMPWHVFANMTDAELAALWRYLRTL